MEKFKIHSLFSGHEHGNGARLIRVFDTTLRDGEQMPGVALRIDQKVSIAKALEELGVNMIEAGFPAVSRSEYNAVKTIAAETYRSDIVALARASRADIDAAIDSDVDMVHIFIATSDIHIKYKLGIDREGVVARTVDSVEYAKAHGVKVLFSAEDATRSDLDYLASVYSAAVDAGADEINIPDTVGVMTPSRMRYLVSFIRERVPGVPIHVHCHNDFGMATANTIAGVEAGADVIQVTVNGFGERAGNASLEETVAALHFLMGYRTTINLKRLYDVSMLVSKMFGVRLQPNKAIVGDNAFSHEAGIHVHGVINNPFTYEPISPEDVGATRRIVLGKHSGRHSVEWALKVLGYTPSDALVTHLLDRIKELAENGVKVDEQVIRGLVAEYMDGA